MNRIAAPFEKLPSYSIYLKYTYRDLIASLGLKQAPHCSGAKGIVGSGASRVLRSGDDDRIESRSEQRYELPYCEAYNLILTSMWMMAVPRSAQKADGLIAVNGLGELHWMKINNFRFCQSKYFRCIMYYRFNTLKPWNWFTHLVRTIFLFFRIHWTAPCKRWRSLRNH